MKITDEKYHEGFIDGLNVALGAARLTFEKSPELAAYSDTTEYDQFKATLEKVKADRNAFVQLRNKMDRKEILT